ncbi:MAG: peptidoglycan-associated lipoprotein Pal [Gallionella sp.]
MKKVSVVLLSILIAACASTPKSPSPPTPQANESKTPSESSVTTATAPTAETESHKLAVEIQDLQQQSVYFDFDKSIIKSEYQDNLLKQAAFLKAHNNDVVTIEGNCDERGSPEYNLALGDRRADAARKSLEILGVPETQIKVVSFGLEKPRLTCHEERCWKENRRDDFVHKLD